MAAGNVSRVLHAPGRVVIGPTDLSLAFPYGGTEVGKTRLVVMTSLGGPGFRIESEADGEASEILEPYQRYVITFFLRGWDDDAVRLFFIDNHDVGEVSGHAVFQVPGTANPGASAMGRALTFLYVPDDLLHAPAMLAHRAVPDWDDGAQVAFQRQDELGIPVALECFRLAGRILEIGRLADLTL